MKQFQLSKQPRGQTTTRFHVLASDDSICGIITVPNEQTADLERHWLGAGPQAKAQATLTPAGKQENPNPMVSAMLRVARKHPLTPEAILRGS